jgi:guanylate kinase
LRSTTHYMPPYRQHGVLFVLSGPSGVGKDAVLTEVQRRFPGVERAVTATTRPIRPGERPDVDYHLLVRERFPQPDPGR